MRNRILSQSLAVMAGLTLITANHVRGATLAVGDPAPKLTIAKWAQGEPVKEFEPSKAYVVEFWATWCGPCVKTIPHLNELHEKFKDKGLVVIGQNLGEDEGKVKPFIEKMADTMTYRVAIDDKSTEARGAMAKNWMTAAGQNGIPCAFIVDKKGKIAWVGHPASLKEGLLEDILADRYDPKKGPAKEEDAPAVKKEEKKKAPAPRPAAVTKNHQRMTAIQQFGASLREQDWDAAETALTELEKLLPENQRALYTVERFQIFMGRKDFDGAYKFLSQTSDAHLQNATLQNRIAWAIATRDGMAQRDLVLAEKAADRAVIASNGKDANLLDTLARVQFMTGKPREAVATQQKAVEVATTEAKAGLRISLASYQAGKLPDEKN